MSALGPVVRVEVVALAVRDGRVAHRLLPGRPLGRGEAPDAVARKLAGDAGEVPGAVLHSTSWRSEPDAIVLTYALFPSPNATDDEVVGRHVVTGPDATHPAPRTVTQAHLAAHAVRHLADLSHGRDPHITRCAEGAPGPWTALRQHALQVHVDHKSDPASVDLDLGAALVDEAQHQPISQPHDDVARRLRSQPVLSVRAALTDGPAPLGLDELVAACADADEHAPFEEHTLLTLRGVQQLPHALLEVRGGTALLGCAVLSEGLDGWSLEVGVRPDARGRGVGGSLLRAAFEHVAQHGGGTLRSWVHSPSGAALQLARSCGARTERRLLVLRRPLQDLPPVRLLEGMQVRSLQTGDSGERDRWLALSNAAFAGHADNGGWTRADVDWRMDSGWTDARRFPVLVDEVGLAAGVWTKAEPDSKTGELYVVAVHPRVQGRGLGRVVVHRALQELRDARCHRAELYVDAVNASALGLYRSAGFATGTEHHCMVLDVRASDSVLHPATAVAQA